MNEETIARVGPQSYKKKEYIYIRFHKNTIVIYLKASSYRQIRGEILKESKKFQLEYVETCRDKKEEHVVVYVDNFYGLNKTKTLSVLITGTKAGI
jgi:DNA-dependent RNA polymerase auxiliary subunit epsilon